MSKTSADTGFFTEPLSSRDPELFGSITAELGRQRDEIELIASENIVSRAVMEAQGSVMTNKYAEGYPGKRYYGGCQFVDVAENLAIDRAKKLFNCASPTCSPIRDRRRTRVCSTRSCSPATPSWACRWMPGGHLTHGAAVEPVRQMVQGRPVRRA
jgi:glycine hydroxymethyltransferase